MTLSSVTAGLDARTVALVEKVAMAQGRTKEAFAAQAIREAAEYEADLQLLAQKGVDDFAQGRWITHEQMVAHLRERRQARATA